MIHTDSYWRYSICKWPCFDGHHQAAISIGRNFMYAEYLLTKPVRDLGHCDVTI
jgi:hypothetical protein